MLSPQDHEFLVSHFQAQGMGRRDAEGHIYRMHRPDREALFAHIKAGTDAAPATPPRPAAGGAIGQWDAAVASAVADGKTKVQAIVDLVHSRPDLHQRYITEVNRG